MRKTSLLVTLVTLLCGMGLLSAYESGLLSPRSSGQGDPPRKSAEASLPYFTSFDEESSLDDWTIVNNSEYNTWRWQNDQYNLYGHLNLTQRDGYGLPNDHWAITPGFRMSMSSTYRLQFLVQNWFDADMHVYLLNSTDPETAEKISLYDYIGNEWGTKSAEFAPTADGVYYIGFHDTTPWRENGTALSYQIYIDDLRVEELSNNAVPESPGDLRQVPGENGEVSMSLKWTNPTLSKLGETLDGLSKATVYKDGVLAKTYDTDVTPGAKMEWEDPAPTEGRHTYSVVISNTTGDSDPAVVNTFIGIDAPGAPENLSVDYDRDGGVITIDWETPQFGAKGGWYDPEGLSYRIVRQPGNKVLATQLDDEMYEDYDVTEYGNYIYQVTSRNVSGLGATATSNGVIVGTQSSLPIFQGWENPDTYAAWTIVDNNNDGHTLHVKNAYGHESPSCLVYDYMTTDADRDEVVYSPPVYLEKGKRYAMSFAGSCNMISSYSVEMRYGKKIGMGDQRNLVKGVYDVNDSPGFGEGYGVYETEFTADETGVFYFSWHLFDADRHTWLDDFSVREVFDKNVAATAVNNLNTAPSAGDELTTGVTYTNLGKDKTSSFTVQLIDDDDLILAEQKISRSLAAGASGNASLKWTVPVVSGSYAVRGRVVMDGDQCGKDNVSDPVYVNVREAGHRAVTIGTSTEVSEKLPFSYEQIKDICQTIYKAEDFNGLAGNITSMAVKVRFGMNQDYPGMRHQVYLANTTKENMADGWLNANMMTKVFDGDLDFNMGAYELQIPFDKPFAYSGGNLCVLIVADYNSSAMMNNGFGLGTYVSEYGLCSTRYNNYSSQCDHDINNFTQTRGGFASCVPNVIFDFDLTGCTSISGTVTDEDGNAIEGVTISGGYPINGLKVVTDKDGRYRMPYVPAGYASVTASACGFQDATGSGWSEAGQENVIDLTMKKLVEIKFIGNVVDARDNTTPVAGAEVRLDGQNSFSAITDENGCFEFDGIYASTPYAVFSITKEGFKTINYNGMRFSGTPDYPYTWNNIGLNPLTASPYSVAAVDKGETAEISWELPIEDHVASKSNDIIYGLFGGAYEMNVGHRYSAEEIAELGVDGEYYVKKIGFVPMTWSSFKLAVWQGEYQNEALVYMQDVMPMNIGAWNDFSLEHPVKVDPNMSIVVGYIVDSVSGAYPIGYDNGPVTEGGDCLFDADTNAWSTAHGVLPQMNANWNIRATFGNDPNSAPVEWAQTKAPAMAMSIDQMITTGQPSNRPTSDIKEHTPLNPEMKAFETPMALAPTQKTPARNEIKGYNVFRMLPGNEGMSYLWTKVNEEPVVGTNYTDESWSGIEDKPYRYAVTSFYGNPYAWGNGIMSDPTFSDGVDKGRYSTVTVNLTADKGNAEEAVVFLMGGDRNIAKTVEKDATSVTFDNVRFSDYRLLVMKPYYERIVRDLTIDSKETSVDCDLLFSAAAPENFDAVDYIKETRLSWDAPSSVTTSTLQWGDGEFDIAYALYPGQETIVGQCSKPEHRVDLTYGDFYFTGIRFYANAAVPYSPLIWSRKPLGSLVEERRQTYEVSDDEVGSWITVMLDEPLKINPDHTYYYGYAATTPDDNTAPFAYDKGPWDYEGSLLYGFDQKEFKYNWYYARAAGNVMVGAIVSDTPDMADAKYLDVDFDLYRFPANDIDNESTWTKVNAEPLKAPGYVDSDWDGLDNQKYRYAVKANFFDDIKSSPAVSKILDKGKVSLVTVDLTTNNGASPEGAKVTVAKGNNGLVIAKAYADANGHCEIPEVAKSMGYKIKVAKTGFDEVTKSLDAREDYTDFAYELQETKAMPGYVEAYPTADNSSVEVNWRNPGAYAPKEGWAYWDNNSPYGGYGTSVGFCAAAQYFSPEDQEEKGMKELDITRIAFFPTQSTQNPVSDNAYWIVKIWRINNDMTVEEVATGDAKDVTLNQWNEVELDEPYHIDGTEMLLVGYEFHGSGNAMGIDNGPLVINKGDWANFGDGWQTLSSMTAFNYNNLIHAYCENLNRGNVEKAPALSAPQRIIESSPRHISISKAAGAAQAADHKAIESFEYPVKGYNVYRLPLSQIEDESAWTLLTQDAIQDSRFTDRDWKNVAKGKYLWAVKALYASGESEPAFCQLVVDESGNLSDVDGVEISDFSISRIDGNTLLIDVPESTTLNVFSADGLIIMSQQLTEGRNTVTVNATEGVYLFNITTGGKAHTFKYVID